MPLDRLGLISGLLPQKVVSIGVMYSARAKLLAIFFTQVKDFIFWFMIRDFAKTVLVNIRDLHKNDCERNVFCVAYVAGAWK